MNKEVLQQRIQMIDGQMQKVREDINNLNAHLYLLDGGKQEALHWLQHLAIKEANQSNEDKKLDEVSDAYEQTKAGVSEV